MSWGDFVSWLDKIQVKVEICDVTWNLSSPNHMKSTIFFFFFPIWDKKALNALVEVLFLTEHVVLWSGFFLAAYTKGLVTFLTKRDLYFARKKKKSEMRENFQSLYGSREANNFGLFSWLLCFGSGHCTRELEKIVFDEKLSFGRIWSFVSIAILGLLGFFLHHYFVLHCMIVEFLLLIILACGCRLFKPNYVSLVVLYDWYILIYFIFSTLRSKLSIYHNNI